MSANTETALHPLARPLVLPTPLEPESPLWRFALEAWHKPGFREVCLALQAQGWSVTRILSAGWLALAGRPYTGFEDATLTEWRSRVTGALRTARQAIPKEAAQCRGLRAGIADLELEAEQLELALAWRTIKNDPAEDRDMQGCTELIQTNLAAAAPSPGAVGDAMPLLNTLATLLAPVPNGDPKP